MPPPIVSILIPNLNKARFLPACLESLSRQTYPHWHAIVNDSHSTDGSWEIIQEASRRDPRISAFQAPPDGMYPNWNRCLEKATGDYVYVATSDDTLEPDGLRKMVDALSRHPECGLAHCCLRSVDEHGMPITDGTAWDDFLHLSFYGPLIRRPHIRIAPHDGLLHFTLHTMYTSVNQLLIRRAVLLQTGPFKTDCGSMADFEWGMKASLLFNTLHVPEYLATWRIYRGQATTVHENWRTYPRLSKLNQMARRAWREALRIRPELKRYAPLPLYRFHGQRELLDDLFQSPLHGLRFFRELGTHSLPLGPAALLPLCEKLRRAALGNPQPLASLAPFQWQNQTAVQRDYGTPLVVELPE